MQGLTPTPEYFMEETNFGKNMTAVEARVRDEIENRNNGDLN